MRMDEDNLEQAPKADFLFARLGWEYAGACNADTIAGPPATVPSHEPGTDRAIGRTSELQRPF